MWVLCRAETILCHHINGVRTLRKIMGKMGVLFALTYKRNNYFPAHVLAEVLRSPSTSNVQRPLLSISRRGTITIYLESLWRRHYIFSNDRTAVLLLNRNSQLFVLDTNIYASSTSIGGCATVFNTLISIH
jgi:hypothetical protein